MFDKFQSTFNFKSNVSCEVFEKKNKCQLTSTISFKMSPQYHMPSSMCHFNFLKCQLTSDYIPHKSQCMSNYKLYMSVDVQFFNKFTCVQCQKRAKTLSKKTHRMRVASFATCCIRLCTRLGYSLRFPHLKRVNGPTHGT